MSLADMNEDQVLERIEDGRIAFAVDIGLSGRKELRVWPEAVDGMMSGWPCEVSVEEVMRAFVPDERLDLHTVEVMRILNASNTHVFNLIEAGELQSCGKWSRGPGGSARIHSESVTNFLRRRLYPAPVSG